MAGLTAWQALFDHADLRPGQTVLVHGAAGAVGDLAVQLAREAGARIIGTGRERDRAAALEAGTERFAALDAEHFEEVAGQVDVVLDTVGGDMLDCSAVVVRPGGTPVSVTAPPKVSPSGAAVPQLARRRPSRCVKRVTPQANAGQTADVCRRGAGTG